MFSASYIVHVCMHVAVSCCMCSVQAGTDNLLLGEVSVGITACVLEGLPDMAASGPCDGFMSVISSHPSHLF